MTQPTFNLWRALRNWQALYPNKAERIQVLRSELRRCKGGGYWSDRSGTRRPREYPWTAKNIERMLRELTS